MSNKPSDRPSLDDIKNAPIPASPDASGERPADTEAEDADLRKAKAETEALGQLVTILKNLRIDQEGETSARKNYFILLPWFVGGWLFILTTIVVFQGFGLLQLSDRVLVALIASTAAGLIGVFATVVTYLFTRQAEQIEFYRLVINKLTSRIPTTPQAPNDTREQ
jgi:hypothetical protein